MNQNICDVYGYVNGKAVYSRDEFIYASRGFGAIETDKELMQYAEKVTSGWQNAGHKQPFTHFYLSDYALSEPKNSLTLREFSRLKELQKEAYAEWLRKDNERCWKLIKTVSFADNSVEELYEDKDGNQKWVMVVAPHGDMC